MVRWRMVGLLMVLAVVLLPVGAQAQSSFEVIEDFEVPIYNKEGKLESMMIGEKAQIGNRDRIKITNLKVEAYEKAKDGGASEVALRLTAPTCDYLTKTKNAESDGAVRIEREEMIITGKGFTWEAEKQRVVIHNDVKVVLRNLQSTMKKEQE